MTPIEEYLRISDSKGVEILLWLLNQRDSKNMLSITLEYAASECKVTKVTVNRIFQKLYKAGFLTKVRNGTYQLHKV